MAKRNNAVPEGANAATSIAPSLEGVAIARLRSVLHGRVIAPNDAEYDTARTVFSGAIESTAGGRRAGRGRM